MTSEKRSWLFKRWQINWTFLPGLRLRLSRTTFPKPAISWHPLRGLSLNTTHGLFLSKSFLGLTLGLKNSNFIFRGRWNSIFGIKLLGFNVNFAKQGFSLSHRNIFGTYNFRNPNRSSARILGIQIRGKKARGIAFIGTLVSLVIAILKTILILSDLLFRLSLFIFSVTWLALAKLVVLIFLFLRLTLAFCWYLLRALTYVERTAV